MRAPNFPVSHNPPPPQKKFGFPYKWHFPKKKRNLFSIFFFFKWRLISYFKFCLFKRNLFFQKLMKVAFSKTSSFQNKIFLHKNVFFPNLSFKNKLRLTFSKKKIHICSNLLKHCWLKTFLRIAYLGICAYDSIPLNHKHQSSLHGPSHFLGTNTFPLSSFLHGKNENTWWMTTSCYPSNPLLYFYFFFFIVIYSCIVFNICMLAM